ncbi:MAG: PaaI family thioesterase [Actinomycetota bacterium]
MTDPPPSAWQLAQQAGDDLVDPDHLATEVHDLTAAVRRLVAAAVATDVDGPDRALAVAAIDEVTERLGSTRRDPLVWVGRHADGRVENLTQAGSGAANPHALPLRFEHATPRDPTAVPAPVEVVGHCTLDDAHGGPPERAHGGVVATMLDEAVGRATVLAGAPGLTAGLSVRFRAPTPLHRPLVVRARYERTEGRTHVATGEVLDGAVVTASAEGFFRAPTPSP